MAAISKQNGRQMRTFFAGKIIFFVISLVFFVRFRPSRYQNDQLKACFYLQMSLFVVLTTLKECMFNYYTLDVMYAGRNYSIDGLLAMCFYCGISFYIFSLFIFTLEM
jgi:hypothetical protein